MNIISQIKRASRFTMMAIPFAGAVGGGLLFTSCYDDKGNYDYITLNEISIDTVDCGIKSNYIVQRYDELSLSPNIKVNGKIDNNANLDYVWTIYNSATSAGIDYTVDTIGTDRELNAQMVRAAGTYTIALTATERDTQVKSFFTVSCKIEGSLTAGWLITYESTAHPGCTDVGLVVNPYVKLNIIKNAEYWNLYENTNGEPIPGKPLSGFRSLIDWTVSPMCLFGTDKTIVGVSDGTFEKIADYNELFYGAPDNPDISYFHGIDAMQGNGEYTIINGKFYYVTGSVGARTAKFGMPVLGNVGELAPWTSFLQSTNTLAVVYDQTNQRFWYLPNGSTAFTSLPTQAADAAFDVNNVGLKFELADWGRNNYNYMLMSNGSERYLAVTNFARPINATTTNIGLNLYDVSVSENIQNAKLMAAANQGAYIYYSDGNKLYRLLYEQTDKADVQWTAPAGETITCVRLQKFGFMTIARAFLPNANTILHIATYNESTGVGKLYQYKIGANDGLIDNNATKYEYTVPGRVKDMIWKWAMGG